MAPRTVRPVAAAKARQARRSATVSSPKTGLLLSLASQNTIYIYCCNRKPAQMRPLANSLWAEVTLLTACDIS